MSKTNKKLLVYLLIVLIPFSFLFLGQAIFKTVRMNVVGASSLPMRIVMFPFKEIYKVFTYHATYRKYLEFKEEVDRLHSRLIGQEEILRENNRFRKLLEFKRSLVFSSVAANVIGRDSSNWNTAIIIDKGTNSGIKTGMPVIASLGIAGRISEVGSDTSKVILLSDPGFSVAALAQRTREVGLISGTLSGMCRMQYVSLDADVETGDKVITSRLSSAFPEGLFIGEVVEVYESQSSPTLECIVQPAVSLTQLEEVLVIKVAED